MTSPLQQVSLFASQDDETLQLLEAKLRKCAFKQGQAILGQNDPGADLYLIQSGHVAVHIIAQNGEKIRLRTMGPGECFGELSLLDGSPRSADVSADSDCQLLALSRDDFLAFFSTHPRVAEALIGLLAGRVRHLTERMQRAGLLGKDDVDLASS